MAVKKRKKKVKVRSAETRVSKISKKEHIAQKKAERDQTDAILRRRKPKKIVGAVQKLSKPIPEAKVEKKVYGFHGAPGSGFKIDEKFPPSGLFATLPEKGQRAVDKLIKKRDLNRATEIMRKHSEARKSRAPLINSIKAVSLREKVLFPKGREAKPITTKTLRRFAKQT